MSVKEDKIYGDVVVSEQINSEDYDASDKTYNTLPEQVEIDDDVSVKVNTESNSTVQDPKCGPGTVSKDGICEMTTADTTEPAKQKSWWDDLVSWLGIK